MWQAKTTFAHLLNLPYSDLLITSLPQIVCLLTDSSARAKHAVTANSTLIGRNFNRYIKPPN
ncbi:hypothetical protein [Nostoc sp. NIES-3756]|uniref:hypothetical protein n=1 Tax=Nostoc sp. NIES-3756 TaxID=1751286 RepID=UPI000A99F507|nr:hypothetical protein [Nostoc sp. NIES-3756]